MMSRNSPKQYSEHEANREWRAVAAALLLNLGDRAVPKALLREQVTRLEELLPMCGHSLATAIKRQRVYALKAKVEGTVVGLRVIAGGRA